MQAIKRHNDVIMSECISPVAVIYPSADGTDTLCMVSSNFLVWCKRNDQCTAIAGPHSGFGTGQCWQDNNPEEVI